LGVMSVSALANQVSIAWNYASTSISAVATEYNSTGAAFRTFQTFCLEDNEYFYPNTKYDFTVGTKVVFGGPLGTGNPASFQLTVGAANLFKAYMNGTIKNARAVQEAIWYNQGYTATAYTKNWNAGWQADLSDLDTSYSSLPSSSTYKSIYFDRTAYDPIGNSNIKVMNLTSTTDGLDYYAGNGVSTQRQSFIYVVPDGGMTISMLGFGFIGLGMLRRKMS